MNRHHTLLRLGALLLLTCAAPSAFAYIGPGAGISLVGAVWAVLASVVLAIVGILWWPVRMVLRRRRQRQMAPKESGEPPTTDPS